VLGATHPEEVTLPTFEGVLEEGEEILLATPEKLTQRLFPCFFTSKK